MSTLNEEPRRASFEREALVHLDALFRVALRFVGNAADADDLVQDTFFQAYRAWDAYQTGTNAKGWLITILRNLFINQYRRDARRREILITHALPAPGPSAAQFIEHLIDDEVTRAIDALPPLFREVIVLSDVGDLRYEEIAALIGIPVGTVKSRLFRARQQLQSTLRDYAITTGLIREPLKRVG